VAIPAGARLQKRWRKGPRRYPTVMLSQRMVYNAWKAEKAR
jgi:hypothetical protein